MWSSMKAQREHLLKNSESGLGLLSAIILMGVTSAIGLQVATLAANRTKEFKLETSRTAAEVTNMSAAQITTKLIREGALRVGKSNTKWPKISAKVSNAEWKLTPATKTTPAKLALSLCDATRLADEDLSKIYGTATTTLKPADCVAEGKGFVSQVSFREIADGNLVVEVATEYRKDRSYTTKAAITIPDSADDPVEVPDNCDPNAGFTDSRLKTTMIHNPWLWPYTPVPGQVIEYELALYDCDGFPKSIVGQPIWFDIDAVTNAATYALPYEITNLPDGGAPFRFVGAYRTVQGADLFGNKGPNWFHWETEAIKYVAPTNKARLKMNVSGFYFCYPGTYGPAGCFWDMYIPTYLKFGPALPTKETIHFTFH